MSVTTGSMLSLLKKAATGSGAGADQVDVAKFEDQVQFFNKLYADKDAGVKDRKDKAQTMVSTFYDLVTDFYETGWGQSFHFACRGKYETFRESMVRHEHFMGLKLGMKETDKVVDVGCGIGGPMRNFVQLSGADVTGITINAYQVRRGNTLNEQAGLSHLCRLREMDYTKMEFEDNSFDKAFAIESTCHAPDRTAVFREVFRVLKPGAAFASYEWVTTPLYDPSNPEHVDIRQKIEEGNALPELISGDAVVQALKDVGFEVELSLDVVEFSNKNGQLPWYGSLEASCSMETLHHSRVGTMVTHSICWALEKVGLAPEGTLAAHNILLMAKEALVRGGRSGIFTPMLLVVARKPLA